MTQTQETGEGAADAAPSLTPNELAAFELCKLASYVAFAVAAGVLYVVATGLPTSRWEPLGAGAFPRIVVALLGLLCLAAMVESVRKLRVLGLPSGFGRTARQAVVSHRLVIFVFATFAVYLLLLRPLGFSIATFLFLFVAQMIAARRTKWTALVALCIAVVFSFGLNYLFGEVFMVFLPRGILG